MLLAAPKRTPQLPMALGVAASATQHPASTQGTYNNNAAKIAFVLSFITAGEAQKWKEQFIRSITNNWLMTFPSFVDFMTKLQDAFKAVNPIDTAMQKLALLWQGNRPVEELITDFRLLIGDAWTRNWRRRLSLETSSRRPLKIGIRRQYNTILTFDSHRPYRPSTIRLPWKRRRPGSIRTNNRKTWMLWT